MKKLLILVSISLFISSCKVQENRYKLACDAVSSYIEETMDTGQMDEFLESPQGKEFVKNYYNK